jgi:CheY-like chemotaxis protein
MDDQPELRKMTARMLRRLGGTVTTVSGANSALEAYRTAHDAETPFDFVILDLTIPGERGGADALLRLREFDPKVCAIAASGYADDAIIAGPLAFGFAAALAKPYSEEELKVVVLTALQRPLGSTD